LLAVIGNGSNDYWIGGKSIRITCSGVVPQWRRLVLDSASNTLPENRHEYPTCNQIDGVEDPAQAWNAVSVGAYTNKVTIDSDARWTDAMVDQFDKKDWLRVYGYGVPDIDLALWSAEGVATIVIEDSVQPFDRQTRCDRWKLPKIFLSG